MDTPRILIVVTSAAQMGDKATGVWLEELAAPYYAFVDAKCEVTIASPKGGAAPIDATSLEAENTSATTRRFEADKAALDALANTAKLSDIEPGEYDAVFFPGGHGTMADLPTDHTVRTVVEHFYAYEKPLAAICHGPACFVSAKKPSGEPLIAGHRFTCFTDEEERAVNLDQAVPFLLETLLREQGGIMHKAKPFVSNVIVEGSLLTGQNPASSITLAESVIHYLRRHARIPRAA